MSRASHETEPLGGIRLYRHQSRRRRGIRRGAVDPQGRAAEAQAPHRTERVSCAICSGNWRNNAPPYCRRGFSSSVERVVCNSSCNCFVSRARNPSIFSKLSSFLPIQSGPPPRPRADIRAIVMREIRAIVMRHGRTRSGATHGAPRASIRKHRWSRLPLRPTRLDAGGAARACQPINQTAGNARQRQRAERHQRQFLQRADFACRWELAGGGSAGAGVAGAASIGCASATVSDACGAAVDRRRRARQLAASATSTIEGCVRCAQRLHAGPIPVVAAAAGAGTAAAIGQADARAARCCSSSASCLRCELGVGIGERSRRRIAGCRGRGLWRTRPVLRPACARMLRPRRAQVPAMAVGGALDADNTNGCPAASPPFGLGQAVVRRARRAVATAVASGTPAATLGRKADANFAGTI